ncbi:hypothetical protein HDU85_006562 [Gaertneriomyces sp. JEL0708]|nr:hypothetical protein HDU85_006562 [Gaertneriomyces sp. JEL0708]
MKGLGGGRGVEIAYGESIGSVCGGAQHTKIRRSCRLARDVATEASSVLGKRVGIPWIVTTKTSMLLFEVKPMHQLGNICTATYLGRVPNPFLDRNIATSVSSGMAAILKVKSKLEHLDGLCQMNQNARSTVLSRHATLRSPVKKRKVMILSAPDTHYASPRKRNGIQLFAIDKRPRLMLDPDSSAPQDTNVVSTNATSSAVPPDTNAGSSDAHNEYHEYDALVNAPYNSNGDQYQLPMYTTPRQIPQSTYAPPAQTIDIEDAQTMQQTGLVVDPPQTVCSREEEPIVEEVRQPKRWYAKLTDFFRKG